jgi:secreted Zn-dependent insulinase-like peptidase
MSKRKNRSSAPDLPKATLERAREQIEEADDEVTPAQERQSRRERQRSRRRDQPEIIQYSQRNKKDTMDSGKLEELLAHPTKFVTEEQLRAEYGYVLADIRSMAVLATVLIVVLVVLAQFI